MLWGAPFQTVHLITLAIAAAIIVGFYFLLKCLPAWVMYLPQIIRAVKEKRASRYEAQSENKNEKGS